MAAEIAIRDEETFLATVDQVRELAIQITNVGDAKDLADRARAAEVWARRAKLGDEKVHLAIAARMWSERRAGELLIEMRENGERVGKNDGAAKSSSKVRLDSLGVTKHESSRWQKLADIPVEHFEQATRRTNDHASSESGIKSASRSARDATNRAEREQAESEARDLILARGEGSCRLTVSDIATWRPADVTTIITDPPYITDNAVALHSALADFAIDVLPDHGALVVMTWQPLLPAVFEAMKRPELVWRWMISWQFSTHQRTPERAPRVFDGWKPVLVFHKNGWTEDTTYLYDTVASSDADKGSHEWGQNLGGFRQLVRAFAAPGETVCDPFVGGGTTAIAALAEARLFVGADIDPEAIAVTKARLA